MKHLRINEKNGKAWKRNLHCLGDAVLFLFGLFFVCFVVIVVVAAKCCCYYYGCFPFISFRVCMSSVFVCLCVRKVKIALCFRLLDSDARRMVEFVLAAVFGILCVFDYVAPMEPKITRRNKFLQHKIMILTRRSDEKKHFKTGNISMNNKMNGQNFFSTFNSARFFPVLLLSFIHIINFFWCTVVVIRVYRECMCYSL